MRHQILLSNQEETIDTTWMNVENYTERKKPISKDYILCGSFHVTFSKRQNHSDKIQIRGCLGEGRREDVIPEGSRRGVELVCVLSWQCSQIRMCVKMHTIIHLKKNHS